MALFPRPRACAAAFILAASGAAQGWASEAPPLPDIRDAYGVAAADFDGDGLLDLYVVGFRTLNRLLINNGNGTFRDRSIPSGAGGNLMPQGIRNLELGAAAADFDNDGYVDLLIAGWGESLELLRNRGDGTFTAVTRPMGLKRDVSANMGVFADLDQDGYLDLLLTNEHGPLRLYRNEYGFRFAAISLTESGLEADSGSQSAAFTDLDLDGDLDLALAGWERPAQVYAQTAPFRFRRMPLALDAPPGIRCNTVVSGDVDQDGDFDLLFTRRGGRSYLLLNRADPPTTAASPAGWRPAGQSLRLEEAGASWGLPDSTDAYGASLADFDADGDLDLFLTARGLNRYLENVQGRFAEHALPHGGLRDTRAAYSTACLAADLSPTPGLELFIAARDSACALLEPRLARGSTLHVQPRGLFANRRAVGARVSLWREEGSSWQLAASREVHGGEGYLSAYVGPALLALPEGAANLRVSVAFPGGKTIVRRVPPEQRVLEVWEGGFFAGAYSRLRQEAHLLLHSPARLRSVASTVAGFFLLVFLLRWAVRKTAQNIARRKYLQELEGKNRELERLIEEVRRTQQQLIQSEKLAGLGQLVAGIAHELNNPIGFIYANLHQIQAYLETLAAGPSTEEREALLRKARAALEESREGSKRVRDIVQNLRGISRAGAPQKGGALDKKPQDLNELLDKSLLLAQTSFSKSLEIAKEFGALPAVPCDATQIQQVFLNILVNAGQAMGQSGRLRLRTYVENGFACAAVADNGPGISTENKARLFEPFFTTKPVGQGLGLGLHISYDIVRAHGGSLDVRSEPGQGAEFTVRLPVAG